jgi:dienelactone hydrolase
MKIRIYIVCIIWFGISITSMASFAQRPLFWGGLASGPHKVGFRSSWEFDYTRTYTIQFKDGTRYASGKAPRPVLINIWYPATPGRQSKSMVYSDYLSLKSENTSLKTFIKELAVYNRNVLISYGIGQETVEDSLSKENNKLLEQMLTGKMAAIRNAPVVKGKFPLVIYHQGLGGSVEDNAVLCEYLASQGYVVINSSYHSAGGKHYNLDWDLDRSIGDLDFLLQKAGELPFVDWTNIAVMGHSYGAQAVIAYAARPNSVVDAVISLDSTIDYGGIHFKGFAKLFVNILGKKHLAAPMLVMANPEASFAVMDSLVYADRFYHTISDLEHNDFTSQAVIGKRLKQEEGLYQLGYETICRLVHKFLQTYLQQADSSYRFTGLQPATGNIRLTFEAMPQGTRMPEPYTEVSLQAPTVRQFWYYYRKHGIEQSINLIRQFRMDTLTDGTPKHAFCQSEQIRNLANDLLFSDKRADGLQLAALEAELDSIKGKNYLSRVQQLLQAVDKPIVVPAETLRRYIGLYTNKSIGFIIEFTVENKHLYMVENPQNSKLIPLSENSFAIDGILDYQFTFDTNQAGIVNELNMHILDGPVFSLQPVK